MPHFLSLCSLASARERVCAYNIVGRGIEQLSEMGFGEDFERLNTVLVQSKMDVSAAADALIASGMPQ